MKHKTAELTGSLLDAAVAQAQGWRFRIERSICEVQVSVPSFSEPPSSLGERGGEFVVWKPYSPSTRWSQAGPIIERERICVMPTEPWDDGEPWVASTDSFAAFYEYGPDSGQYRGSSTLIAAMRAFVASKLGSEVELDT